jgi:hypothetical protein
MVAVRGRLKLVQMTNKVVDPPGLEVIVSGHLAGNDVQRSLSLPAGERVDPFPVVEYDEALTDEEVVVGLDIT